jgi:large-conductance mechanosensitive channel
VNVDGEVMTEILDFIHASFADRNKLLAVGFPFLITHETQVISKIISWQTAHTDLNEVNCKRSMQRYSYNYERTIQTYKNFVIVLLALCFLMSLGDA